ncbi:MAG: Flp pilus assembly complex ATPase component TadA [Magnetococcus sp. THC-1_WYH]
MNTRFFKSLTDSLRTFPIRFSHPVWVLLLQDREVRLLHMGDGHQDSEKIFNQSSEGQEKFRAFVLQENATQGSFLLLADLIDDALHSQTIPGLRFHNRWGAMEKRLDRLFRSTPYRRATPQGRMASGKEQVLFSGLTEPRMVQPWINILSEEGKKIAGLWSLPLLSQEILPDLLPDHSGNTLLVSFGAAGQRHSLFLAGQLIISRLAPRLQTHDQEIGLTVMAEIERTRRYLIGLRLIPSRDAPLDVCVPLHQNMFHASVLEWSSSKDIRMIFHPVETWGRNLGLPGSFPAQRMDLLFAQFLLKTLPASHYKPKLPERTTAQNSLETSTLPTGKAASQPVHRVGDLLVEMKVISEQQLDIALAEQKRLGYPIGKVLVTLGFISEERMRDLLGASLEQEIVDLNLGTFDSQALNYLPKHFAKRHNILPLDWNPTTRTLTVATANTFNMAALDKLQSLLPEDVHVKPKLASESELTAAIDSAYGIELSLEGILNELETGEVDSESLLEDEGNFSNPMLRLVNAMLTDAVKRNASDLHINPMANLIRIRYRIDGVLREARILNRKYLPALVVRIKVMSGLDITETRTPQDGHFSLEIANSSIDFRVSIQPTNHGENMVLRILDRNRRLVGLEQLGLNEEDIGAINRLMQRSEGIILVTGPTGCGKTTTLYAMLSRINTLEKNVMTLEDPLEIPLDAILQTSVNKAVDLDFASGVRSMLRQDPDIIMVGEIRDLETAEMALRAAMTGHQVFSTLHANSAMAAIFRLLNIGLRSDMLAGNITGIMAQRLVRKLCTQCRVPISPDPYVGSFFRDHPGSQPVYRSSGCRGCENTGYNGRTCIMEILVIDDDFNDLISLNAPQADFRKLARERKLPIMADSGKKLVLEGVTSVDEVIRVLGMEL